MHFVYHLFLGGPSFLLLFEEDEEEPPPPGLRSLPLLFGLFEFPVVLFEAALFEFPPRELLLPELLGFLGLEDAEGFDGLG